MLFDKLIDHPHYLPLLTYTLDKMKRFIHLISFYVLVEWQTKIQMQTNYQILPY